MSDQYRIVKRGEDKFVIEKFIKGYTPHEVWNWEEFRSPFLCLDNRFDSLEAAAEALDEALDDIEYNEREKARELQEEKEIERTRKMVISIHPFIRTKRSKSE